MILSIINSSQNEIELNSEDRIFLGEGLFETLRVINKKPCYAALHWQRLFSCAQKLRIDFNLSFVEWLSHIETCLRAQPWFDGGIKILLSGGSAIRGLEQRGTNPHLIFKPFTYSIHSNSLRLLKATWLRDANNPVYQMKSVNYLEAILAKRQTLAQGADDALFFNNQQNVCETTVANIFIISQNRLLTPALNQGVLPGVLRGRIIEQSTSWGILCEETSINYNALMQAEALFVCNVLQGIRTVSSLDAHRYNTKHPLIDKLQKNIIEDYIGSILK